MTSRRRPTPRRKGKPQRHESTRAQWWVCHASGLRAYHNRKAARHAARVAHPDAAGMSAFVCPAEPDHWHYGQETAEGRAYLRRGEADR
ncbi:hypothetical protein [Amycolatopsis solani]|uniref:hypothetical protein n=1 Tax=Amycolatopsis solani TaxID=3028615 RepID=UPI0025B24AD0|nr:hypothetical protein [Amycolatopsis sp. MEP2-6]